MSDHQPQTAETTINFDLSRGIVTVTPKSVGGVAIVNPTPATLSVDTWIEVAATLILNRKAMREQAQQKVTPADRIIGLGK